MSNWDGLQIDGCGLLILFSVFLFHFFAVFLWLSLYFVNRVTLKHCSVIFVASWLTLCSVSFCFWFERVILYFHFLVFFIVFRLQISRRIIWWRPAIFYHLQFVDSFACFGEVVIELSEMSSPSPPKKKTFCIHPCCEMHDSPYTKCVNFW